jgi:hypothetical protein
VSRGDQGDELKEARRGPGGAIERIPESECPFLFAPELLDKCLDGFTSQPTPFTVILSEMSRKQGQEIALHDEECPQIRRHANGLPVVSGRVVPSAVVAVTIVRERRKGRAAISKPVPGESRDLVEDVQQTLAGKAVEAWPGSRS